MNSTLNFTARTFPDRIAELGFTARLPGDWISHALPDDDVDFSDPTLFVPLAVVTAPHAAIVMAFAARPAYDEGSLHDWAWYHLNHQQLQPRAVGRQVVAGVGAVVGEATQPSELGTMVVRFAFLEDGDRLVNLSFTAPELLADAVRDAWFELLRSYTLTTPRGSRFPLEAHADDTPAAPIPEPWLDRSTPAAPLVCDAWTGEPLHAQPHEGRPLPAATSSRRTQLSGFALGKDSISLDEDHPINEDLRQRGRGVVPDIAGMSDGRRQATLAAAAIGAHIDVPFGWHVVDDDHRTLVFEPGGQVQLRLQRVPTDATDAAGAEPGGADPASALQRFVLTRPCPGGTQLLRAGVAAVPAQADNARNLAELMLASCVFDEPRAVEADDAVGNDDTSDDASSADAAGAAGGPPAWWVEALMLEIDDHTDDAESHIRANCPHIGYAATTAEMYRLRMLRLKAAGDARGALQAFRKSSDWIAYYASMATSGGEGAALSMQRDDFLAELAADYGSDPATQAMPQVH